MSFLRVALLGIVCCSTFVAPLAVSAQFLPVELKAIWPHGAAAGSACELSITAGDRLDEIDRLLFSHPGITAEVQTGEPRPFSDHPTIKYGSFNLTVAEDVPAGRYEVWAVGRHGVSNPRSFVVSPLPHTLLPTPSHQPEQPSSIQIPGVIQAKSTAATLDYFSLQLPQAQSLKLECLAQQIDSRMIGYLKLYDFSGRQIAARHGADGFDPVLVVNDLPAGDYLLAVHDFLYRGGEEFFYQLVVQELATATELIEVDAQVAGAVVGYAAPESATAGGQLAADEQTATPAKPQAIELPHQGTWWFGSGHEELQFEFSAEKDQRMVIELASQRLGQPTDARLELVRLEPVAEGETKTHAVTRVEDSQSFGDGILNLHSGDPVTLVSFPETATYRLIVRDLDVGETLSARQKFLLNIREPQPAFKLVAYRAYPHNDAKQARPLGSKLFRGGAEAIRVLAVRHDGWSGPIEVSIEGLPAGVSCRPATIAANQTQTQLTLVADAEAADFDGPLHVIGRAGEGESQLQAEAVPVTVAVSRGAGRDLLRSRRCTQLPLVVSADDLAPLTVICGEPASVTVKKGESLKVPIKLERREGGGAACVLRPRDLPAGVTCGEVTIPADQSAGEVEVKVAGNTANGTYSLWWQTEVKIKIRPNPQAAARAQQYRDALQTRLDDPANSEQIEAIKAAIVEADKAIDAAKAAAGEQELTVFIPSTVATIQVVDP
ncbi:hypothetical protein SH139x_004153 [Planctomycetaceae bacterium SH139]